MNKYRDWEILDELPQGWSIDKTAGSPAPKTVFITNGKSVLSGLQKRALLKVEAKPLLAVVNSSGKLKNECLFCGSRFCYERVVSGDMKYDEVACMKHVKDLHKHSDIVAPKIMKQFISSTGIQKRGMPLLD